MKFSYWDHDIQIIIMGITNVGFNNRSSINKSELGPLRGPRKRSSNMKENTQWNSIDELMAQIAADAEQARLILSDLTLRQSG